MSEACECFYTNMIISVITSFTSDAAWCFSQLKSGRERVVLDHEPLLPLSAVVDVACSDDETDKDATSTSTSLNKQNVTPRRVRRLRWRSMKLQNVMVGIDDYRAKLTRSIPKNSHGRPPRPRVRIPDGPVSKLAAPAGLLVDCYSSEWLSTLTPLEIAQLEIKHHPVLDSLSNFLNAL